MPWMFLRYLPVAKRILAKGRLPMLLLAVVRKQGSQNGLVAELRDDLRLFTALCVAWWRGEYRAVSRPALVAVVAALAYFLSPLDALPDWLPGLGFVDDLAVLTWVMRKWRVELDAFRAWQASQSPEVQADLARLPQPDEPQARP